MGEFSGRAAFVTGGSRGVGRAIALEFAARGASLAVVYKSSRQKAEEVVAAIESGGGKGLALQADVGDPDAVAAAFAKATDTFGNIDVLVHSAGAQVEWANVRDQDPKNWASFIRSDLIGSFNVIHAAVLHMHTRGRGVIVAISSIAAQMCQSRNSQGAAAKAGLEALIRVVAREEGRYGVRANAISIGLTETEQAREAFKSWGEEATRKIIAGIPLQRIGQPEEIARMAAYLAGEDGSYITGKVIQVDGGQLIAG
jgi:Dehydrogenases with different specificities (related to short-chain alcohol dehydrogenases)